MIERIRTAKAPKQARGEERVERLLAAAADLFAARGVDAVTMTEIASAAASAIGTLYQFFPSKADVTAALARRYAVEIRAVLAGLTLDDDIEAELAAAVRGLAAFYVGNPAYVEVQHALNRPGAATAVEAALDADVLRYLNRLIARASPALSPGHRRAAARVMLEAGHALFSAIVLSPAAARASLLRETERMLGLYLRHLADA